MRVLMIAGVAGKAESGGGGVVYNLVKELRNLGHTIKPMFFEDVLPKPRWPKRFRTVEFATAVANTVEKEKNLHDVVNIHAPYGFWYGFRRRRDKNTGPPYVMTMHGLEERRNYAMGAEAKKGRADFFRWQNRLWQRLYHMRTYRWSFETADQCIVLNREALLFLQLRYNLPAERVWFVPNGVGPEFFSQHLYPSAVSPSILFAGTWIDHKGIYYLVEAFEKLQNTIPGVRLTIAGCSVPQEIVRQSFSPKVQQALEVLPVVARADMPALYARHDIFVLPSLVEGMPLVLLEAMASGLPVITTESSGMTDLIENRHDGVLVIPGNTESLIAAVKSLCGDYELRSRLGRAAQEKMKRFSWTQCARQHELVFARAMGIENEFTVPVEARAQEQQQNADLIVRQAAPH
jgi:glycosyltransferase involved in cell wall biosynthesis